MPTSYVTNVVMVSKHKINGIDRMLPDNTTTFCALLLLYFIADNSVNRHGWLAENCCYHFNRIFFENCNTVVTTTNVSAFKWKIDLVVSVSSVLRKLSGLCKFR